MSHSLAQLERAIYIRHLRIPAQSLPPNYFQLLGLDRNEADRFAVQLAGELRKDIVRAIDDPQLLPAVPAVLAQLDTAIHCLLSRAERQAYERGLSAPPPTQPVATFVAVQPAPQPIPVRPLAASPPPHASDPLGLGKMAPADIGRPVLLPGSSNSNDRRILVLASVVGALTISLLLIVIVVTRLLRGVEFPIAETTVVVQVDAPPRLETPALAVAPSVLPTPTLTEDVNDTSPAQPLPPEINLIDTPPDPSPALPSEPAEPSTPPPPADVPPLPAEVTLPKTSDSQEHSLGRLPGVDADLSLDLDSGASDSHTWHLEALPAATDERMWAVTTKPRSSDTENAFTSGDTPVADFIVRGNDLRFRWRKVIDATMAAQLKNCVLEISSKNALHSMQLRKPLVIPPHHVRLNDRREKIGLPVQDWPLEKQLFLQILECEEFQARPVIEPTDQRVFSNARGAIVLPGADKAEITYGLNLTKEPRVALFESRYFLNRGEAELTFDRVDQSIADLQDGLLTDQNALLKAQARLVAALQEADAIRNAGPPAPLTAQAELLLRSQRLQQLSQEVTKANVAIARLQKSIPRTQTTITEVQTLRETMEDWRKGVIHWRLGAKTTRGEITLITTRK